MREINPPANVYRRPNILRRSYDWVLSWSESPYSFWALIGISFLESSIFPIPPDILLIALVLGNPEKWWRLALTCTVASVIGGMLGYSIGVFSWEVLGRWIVENIAHVRLVVINGRADIPLPTYFLTAFGSKLGGEYLFQVYDHWNAWIVFVFGLTPLPYKLVTITAGVARVNFAIFLLTSIAARSLRFFVVAWLLKIYGERAKNFIDKYFNLLCFAFVLMLVGGFAILKVLF